MVLYFKNLIFSSLFVLFFVILIVLAVEKIDSHMCDEYMRITGTRTTYNGLLGGRCFFEKKDATLEILGLKKRTD